MKIIVGIGNPGKKYAETRHNIGFVVVSRLAEMHELGSWRRRFHSRAAEGCIGNVRVLLLKPDTFVNESGRAVREAMVWCRAEPQDIMITCDDFHLPLGKLRVRGGGRSGGHNGLDSVIAHLDTEDVPRLRLGIGIERKVRDRDFVLSTFEPAEREVIDEAVTRAVRALEVWLQSGLERCQNGFNTDPASASQKKKEGG